jgi:hypothetical protein
MTKWKLNNEQCREKIEKIEFKHRRRNARSEDGRDMELEEKQNEEIKSSTKKKRNLSIKALEEICEIGG